MARVLDENELVGNWTLVGDELDQLSGKFGRVPPEIISRKISN